jgi:hypothetical protein
MTNLKNQIYPDGPTSLIQHSLKTFRLAICKLYQNPNLEPIASRVPTEEGLAISTFMLRHWVDFAIFSVFLPACIMKEI